MSDSHSQSFFLQPLTALERAGVRMKTEQKFYYPDIHSLLEAFIFKEIDIVSVPDVLLENIQVEPVHKLEIASSMPSGTWFVNQQVTNTVHRCLLLSALDRFDFLIDHNAQVELSALRCGDS